MCVYIYTYVCMQRVVDEQHKDLIIDFEFRMRLPGCCDYLFSAQNSTIEKLRQG